jgi:hypothetical protein
MRFRNYNSKTFGYKRKKAMTYGELRWMKKTESLTGSMRELTALRSNALNSFYLIDLNKRMHRLQAIALVAMVKNTNLSNKNAQF